MNRMFPLAIGMLLLCSAMQSPAHGQESTPDSSTAVPVVVQSGEAPGTSQAETHAQPESDYWSLIFVFMLSTFIGMGVIARVSRLLHTPLMSMTNAISAIAVVGSIIVTGSDYPMRIRILGAIALFASMTNIVSGFLITDRMLKMFKQNARGEQRHEPSLAQLAYLVAASALVCLFAPLDERSRRPPARACMPAWSPCCLPCSPPGFSPESSTTVWIVLAIIAGFAVGVPLSRVPLTAVPQRTALSHAFGGLAAGWSAPPSTTSGSAKDRSTSRPSGCGHCGRGDSGLLTFTGSLMAAGKLQEMKWIPQRPVTYLFRTWRTSA